MSFTKEQLEERKRGIGASEAAAALGLNPYRTPLEVWMNKKGLLEIEETPSMRLGTRLEPVIAEMYQDHTGLELEPAPTLFYTKNPIIFATPDRIVKGRHKGLEIKTANARMAEQWGEEGTDEVPHYYLIQCILCMAVTDLPEWDVAALIGGSDFRIYTIHRDLDIEKTIIERLLEWWEMYIVGNREPEIDPSRSCAEYLAAKYPRNFKPLKEADETTEQLLSRLAEVKNHLKSFEEQEEAIKNLLKNYIGDADGVQGVAGKATWKKTADSSVIDYESLSLELLANLSKEEKTKYVKKYSTIKEGHRRFVFREAK